MEPSQRFLVILGVTVSAITASVLYLLFKSDEEDHDHDMRSSRRTEIKIKVPNECISSVIGRGGCKVKEIQDRTGARIHCNDESASEKFRVVTIRGTPEAAQLAESMIHEIVMNQPITLSHEMWVPSRACGRIIGKGGDTIRHITMMSCAKIAVDSHMGDSERAGEKRVVLKGTAEQIALAKTMIEEKVKEESDSCFQLEKVIQKRVPRQEPKDNSNCLTAPSNVQDEKSLPYKFEKFETENSEGFFDVFVSAMCDPGQFWVQLLTRHGVELDQLEERMTEFYSNPENQTLHSLTEVNVGQLVAAPFQHDEKWYRAEIIAIEENEYDPAESKVNLYYVDYGDSDTIERKSLFDLRTDFLSVNFQAIECSLANVKPSAERWSDEASELFQALAEVAMWRKMRVHVVTYKDSAHTTGQRATSRVPVVELHNMEKGINIGEELVRQGFAVKENITLDPSKPISNGQDSKIESDKKSIQTKSDITNIQHHSKMSPSKIFGQDSTIVSDNQRVASSSFIEEEKNKTRKQGFIPRTLDVKEVKRKAPKQIILVPEIESSEDEDGFDIE